MKRLAATDPFGRPARALNALGVALLAPLVIQFSVAILVSAGLLSRRWHDISSMDGEIVFAILSAPFWISATAVHCQKRFGLVMGECVVALLVVLESLVLGLGIYSLIREAMRPEVTLVTPIFKLVLAYLFLLAILAAAIGTWVELRRASRTLNVIDGPRGFAVEMRPLEETIRPIEEVN